MKLLLFGLLLIFFVILLLQLCKERSLNNLEKYTNINNRYACLYAYYEKDELYKENLTYFLENGLLDNIDYYIILNGTCTIDIPIKNNIKVFRRENKGYDFGAWSYAIKHIDKTYDYYVFLNTSVKGPFLKDKSKPWIDYFIELFNTLDIKLVGTSINMYPLSNFEGYNLDNIYHNKPPHTHIQSMFFCMNHEYYQFLKGKNFFNEEELNNIINISDVITYKEFGLSQLALNNNWNINSILPKFKDIDYRLIKENFNTSSYNGDPYFINCYFGKSIDPYEAIFFKVNRGIPY